MLGFSGENAVRSLPVILRQGSVAVDVEGQEELLVFIRIVLRQPQSRGLFRLRVLRQGLLHAGQRMDVLLHGAAKRPILEVALGFVEMRRLAAQAPVVLLGNQLHIAALGVLVLLHPAGQGADFLHLSLGNMDAVRVMVMDYGLGPGAQQAALLAIAALIVGVGRQLLPAAGQKLGNLVALVRVDVPGFPLLLLAHQPLGPLIALLAVYVAPGLGEAAGQRPLLLRGIAAFVVAVALRLLPGTGEFHLRLLGIAGAVMTVPGVQHAALFIQNLLRLGEAADELLPCPGGVAAVVMDMGLLLGKGAGKHLAALRLVAGVRVGMGIRLLRLAADQPAPVIGPAGSAVDMSHFLELPANQLPLLLIAAFIVEVDLLLRQSADQLAVFVAAEGIVLVDDHAAVAHRVTDQLRLGPGELNRPALVAVDMSLQAADNLVGHCNRRHHQRIDRAEYHDRSQNGQRLPAPPSSLVDINATCHL